MGRKNIISHGDQIKHKKKEAGTGIQGGYGADQLLPGYSNFDKNKATQDDFNSMDLNLHG